MMDVGLESDVGSRLRKHPETKTAISRVSALSALKTSGHKAMSVVLILYLTRSGHPGCREREMLYEKKTYMEKTSHKSDIGSGGTRSGGNRAHLVFSQGH